MTEISAHDISAHEISVHDVSIHEISEREISAHEMYLHDMTLCFGLSSFPMRQQLRIRGLAITTLPGKFPGDVHGALTEVDSEHAQAMLNKLCYVEGRYETQMRRTDSRPLDSHSD